MLAAAGLAVAAGLVLWLVFSIAAPLRFLAPGAGTLEIEKPGRYVVWNEYRGTFQNRIYRAEPELPQGMRFTILAPGGRVLPLRPGGQESWSEGDAERRAIGAFTAPAPGRYSIVVEGNFPPRVIAVGADFVGRIVGVVLGAGAALLLGIGGGVGMLVYAIGRSEPKRKDTGGQAPARASAPPAPVPDTEKQLVEIVTLVYVLQALSIGFGVTLIGGAVIDYLKREEAAGTWLESHIRWQLRTFWWTLAWGLIGLLTFVILIGALIWLLAAIWFAYRVARGWVALRARRPVP